MEYFTFIEFFIEIEIDCCVLTDKFLFPDTYVINYHASVSHCFKKIQLKYMFILFIIEYHNDTFMN